MDWNCAYIALSSFVLGVAVSSTIWQHGVSQLNEGHQAAWNRLINAIKQGKVSFVDNGRVISFLTRLE